MTTPESNDVDAAFEDLRRKFSDEDEFDDFFDNVTEPLEQQLKTAKRKLIKGLFVSACSALLGMVITLSVATAAVCGVLYLFGVI